jgi:glucosamine--fructose-6-phosphate aminotransferase (isomerizing)
MCGIVGYVGKQDAVAVLVGGLRRLEYRGYDSAGIAVSDGQTSRIVRCRGKLSDLEQRILTDRPRGSVGIGHTRWATHGRPSDENAHPHRAGRVSVVHNGIVENHIVLRSQLQAAGRTFSSETDTEILAHLIDMALDDAAARPLAEAVRVALRQVSGSYAVLVLSDLHPGEIVAAKQASPLVVGQGEDEMFLASDAPALLDHTRHVTFLEDGDVVEMRPSGITVSDLDGVPRTRASKVITWTADLAEKAGYPHFMLKEIHEQPMALRNTWRGRLVPGAGEARIDGCNISATPRRLVLVACGTSYHAALIGKFFIESMARIPCEVDLASEFRYRDPVIGPEDPVIGISQSGETADTLAAMKEAKVRGAPTLAICNVVDSSIPRMAGGALYTHAGPEISVASTKCFTAQLAALVLLGLHLGRRSGALTEDRANQLGREFLTLPDLMAETLADLGDLKKLAAKYKNAKDFLFLGRGTNFPIALEGALKLKEISYVHAEGYPAGEMKHGPIALIDDGIPVVIVAPRGQSYEKVLSNLSEIKARRGHVIAVATKGDTALAKDCEDVLWVPDASSLLQPFLTVLPLQILAYAMACARGNDVDQPRNLAKSVTVE